MLTEFRPSFKRLAKPVGRPLIGAVIVALVASAISTHTQLLGSASLPELPLSLFASTLGIVVGFRTNSAYNRWWEARTLWGALINDSRNWARQIISFTRAPSPERTAELASFRTSMVHAHIGYVHALRRHLRGEAQTSELAEFFADPGLVAQWSASNNVPAAILHWMGTRISEGADQGLLSDYRLVSLDQTLRGFANVQGGSERIRNTPFPREYDYYPHLFVYLYCFLFPLAVVQRLGYFTPLLTLIIGFVLLVVIEIGKNLEDPFSNVVYGVPLESMTRTIEINLRAQLGETRLPPPIAPKDGVLP